MPRRLRKPPAYRLHKPTGQAVARIDGKDNYLGKFGTDASHEKYRRLVAEWLTSPRPVAETTPASPGGYRPTVSELILAYWDRHVVTYYVKNGRPTSEQDNIRQALRFLRRLYGQTEAEAFGPLALKAVRGSMIEAGRCRTLINKDVNRIKGLFRWAVENELLPVTVHQALRAVAGLRKGRSEVKEARPVEPVAEEVVGKTLPHLSPQVAAMVRLQLLTGARPGEIAMMRPRDITASGHDLWVYQPESHKTEHFDRGRIIVLGPRGQEVMRPWLDRSPDAYCFSPAEVTASRNARRRERRRSPMTPSQAARRQKSSPERAAGLRYTKDSYRRAIVRACQKAGVPEWTPLQLRHTAGTAIRAKYGLEAAQVVLGHAEADTTQIYAERDLAKVRAVMAEIG